MTAVLEMARRGSYNARTKDFVWDLVKSFEDFEDLPAKHQAEFEMKCRYQEWDAKSNGAKTAAPIPEYRVREI